MTNPEPDAEVSLPRVKRDLAYIGIILVVFMTNIDGSIVNVALPQLSRSLQADPQSTVWVTTTYLLAVGCAVPATAALGDQLGRRHLFLMGVPVFTLASLGCALSTTLPMLVAFRAIQGLGSAALFAVIIPIMRMMFPAARMGVIFGINAMATALGVAIGPTLGGIILARLAWPWLFLINVPLGAIAFLLALYAVPKHQGRRGDYDGIGALTIGVAIALFVVGVHLIVDIRTLWIAALLVAVAVGFVVAFLRAERRVPRPVLPLPMWNGVFSLAVLTAFWSFFGQGVAFVALPFLFQSAYGVSPLQSALLFTPWPAVIVLAAPLSGRLADRFRPAVLAIAGLAVYLVGLILLATLGDHPAQWWVLVCTAICGLGFAFFQSPNNREMQGAVPMSMASSGAAVLNLNRSVAQSAGSGMVSIALVLFGATAGSTLQEARAATSVLWVAVAGAAFSLVFSALKLRSVLSAERSSDHAVQQ